MTWLYILAAVLLVLALLAVSPAVFYFYYDSESGKGLLVDIRYLFVKLRLYPNLVDKLNNKPKKRKEGKKADGKPPEKAAKKKKKPFMDRLGTAVSTIGDVIELLGELCRKTRFTRCNVDMIISTDDAAETAISYGAASAAVNGLLAMVENFTKIKRADIKIEPDFLAGRCRAKVDVVVKLPLYAAAVAVFRFVLKYEKNKSAVKSNAQTPEKA